jgi:hypothetical protein
MKVKPFRFHKTEGANDNIKQGDACFFACNSIGITYNQVTAMFTDQIPTFSHIASFGMLKDTREAPIDSKLARGVRTNGVLAREFTLC